ncbi:MAG: hypothetical protein K0R67_1674, partial [Paenibacillus sp.]|nr:hypothetical protein [Paenibacillus sp.]
MNVSLFINKLPEAVSQYMHKEIVAALPSASVLVDRELSELLTSNDGLAALLLGLRVTEKQTLRTIVAEFACEPFEDTKLLKLGRMRLSGAALKVGLMRLCRKGIVFALRRSWGEQLYTLPTDTYKLWLKLLFPKVVEQIVPKDETEVVSISHEMPLPSARILTLLAYCHREGLPLTQKGVLVKRHLIKLLSLLRLEPGEQRLTEVRYTGEEAYPFTFAVILDAALRQGILEQYSEGYVIDEKRLQQWLALTEQDMNRAFYAQLAPMLLPAFVPLRHWIAYSEEIAPGLWFSVNGLLEGLRIHLEMDKKGLQLERIVAEWLEPLSSLGLFELGRDGAGELLARWCSPTTASDSHQLAADRTETHDSFFVQPDFDIIVPPGVPYEALWQLEHLGIQEQSGPVSRYRLSKDRVLQSYRAGFEEDQMVAFLRKYAKFGLPELVEYSMRQWISSYDKMGNISLNEGSKTNRNPQKKEAVMQGLIYSREHVQYYDIERSIPRTEDLYPGLAEVPNMWLKECRSYHAATRAEIIRKALEWKACIRLRQAGQDKLLVPERIEGTSDSWLVSGFNLTGELKLA